MKKFALPLMFLIAIAIMFTVAVLQTEITTTPAAVQPDVALPSTALADIHRPQKSPTHEGLFPGGDRYDGLNVLHLDTPAPENFPGGIDWATWPAFDLNRDSDSTFTYGNDRHAVYDEH